MDFKRNKCNEINKNCLTGYFFLGLLSNLEHDTLNVQCFKQDIAIIIT